MKKYIYLIILFVFQSNLIYSQDNTKNNITLNDYFLKIEKTQYTDSIATAKVIKDALTWSMTIQNKGIQSQIHAIASGFNYLYDKTTQQSEYHKNLALKLANESKNNSALALAYIEKGNSEKVDNNYDLSILSYLQAVDYAKKTNDFHIQTKAYLFLSEQYRFIGDYNSQLKNAKLSLETANKSIFKNTDLAKASFEIALHYSNVYNEDKNKLDSNFKLGLMNLEKMIYYTNQPDCYRKKGLAEAYYNMAVLYYYQNKIENKKIILDNLNLANQNAEKFNHSHIYCMNRLMQIDYLFKDNDLVKIEKILKEVDVKYATFENDLKVLNAFELYNEKLYEKKGDKAEALIWCKDFVVSSQKLYSLDRTLTVKKAEAKYINKAKIQELITSKKENSFQKKLNLLYLTLIVFSVLGILLMYKYYRTYKKTATQEQQLLLAQQQETILKAKISEEEALNAINEKDLALQDKQLALQENFLNQQQKDTLQQTLLYNNLQIERKTDLIRSLQQHIADINAKQAIQDKRIDKLVEHNVIIDEELDFIQKELIGTNPSFFTILQEQSQNLLSNLDIKYCAYIKMGMSNREIAQMLNIEQKSVRMARYRLKQKLQLSKTEELDHFIYNLQ